MVTNGGMKIVWGTFFVVAVGCAPSPKPPSYPLEPVTACGSSSHVAVFGAVQRPGKYDCRAGMHLADAVAAAGGLTPLAYSSRVTLERGNVKYRVNFGRIVEGMQPDPALGDGDIVFVGERID